LKKAVSRLNEKLEGLIKRIFSDACIKGNIFKLINLSTQLIVDGCKVPKKVYIVGTMGKEFL